MKETTLKASRQKYEEKHTRKKITFTQKEYNRVLRRWTQSGEQNVNQFIKKCALETTIKTSNDNVIYKQMTAQLRRIGNNINQIAFQLNAQQGSLSSADIREQIAQVKDLIKKIHRP